MPSDTTSKMFTFKGLSIETNANVYDPAEDTFLLLEALNVKPNDCVLEIGIGCGIISLECARLGAQVVGVEVNPFAVKLAGKNFQRNKSLLNGGVDFRVGDLFSSVKPDERFDVIIFNPPYLPTKEHEKVGGWFDVAVNGGVDGFKVVRRFLSEVKKYLLKEGNVFFVFSSLANEKLLVSILSELKMSSNVVLSRSFNDETLKVYNLTKM